MKSYAVANMKYKLHTNNSKPKKKNKKTRSLTNCKTDHERVGKMRNLERLNLRSRDLEVVLFDDDTVDCGREFQGWTTLVCKEIFVKVEFRGWL